MIKVLVRAEVGTADDAFLQPEKIATKKLEGALKKFVANTPTDSGEILEVALADLFFQNQFFLSPANPDRFPAYKARDENDTGDVAMLVVAYGIAFTTDDVAAVTSVMNKISTDDELTSFYGLGWKLYDQDTDLPASARPAA